ncbi:MAG: SGNH/GDSL hydrolase family protein [Candidatus Parabeggiatoa sp. nov. 1]|nr:MAG: SGNH/GDSL hydrolase family protein [Gammaproteobacteria bacterium]HEC84269.1 SGNH/GDSL hydrolase family protein [Thioploca sp.]
MNKYTNTHSPIGKNAKSIQKFSKKMGIAAFSAAMLALSQSAVAENDDDLPALLVIGASGVSGNTPINDNMDSVLGGVAVNYGSFLALGDALIRIRQLPGFVINEGQAGAGTFDRLGCNPGPECGPGWWTSFDKQFDRALARVTMYDPENPANILGYNAEYVVIGIPNDCLHSDAFGIPQSETQPCTLEEFNAVIDRLIAVGQRALDLGITPIYNIYPECSQETQDNAIKNWGLSWWIDVEECEGLRYLHRTRIAAELPDALVEDVWRGFTTSADGMHADRKTSMRAARRIARAIKKHRRGN